MFTGTSISSLNQVAAQEDYTTLLIGQVTVEAEAGTTYQICVDGDLGLPGTFSLNVAQTRPPIVILTDSPNQGNYLSDSCVPLAAQAFDPDGSVRQVEFRLTDQTYYAYRPVGLATNRPFSINWTNPSLSWHSVIALATDDLGAIGMSIPITFNVRPPNDDFAKRIALTGSFLTVTGSTLGATLEPGEPSANDSSIWWSWTAPADGPVTLTTPGNYALAVYTGSSVSSLTQVAYSTSADFGYTTRLVFAAAAGGTYQLAVNRQLGVGGDLTLQIARHLPPIVVVVSPTNQSRFINSDVLLIAADASDSGGAITRVDFYQDWMLIGTVTNPPYDLTVTLSATSLVGHSLQVWATDDHGITTASAAVYYEVSPPGPPNDNFANRIAITGAGLAVTGTLAYATGEIGEPGNLDAHSVWWAWTAPATATFTCTIVSELGFYPAVGVFAGTAVTNLSLVAYNAFNGSDNSYSARVTFEAATATTYAIGAAIIAGTPGGQYALSIGQGTPPTITISSPTNGSVFEAGTNITITAEASDSDGIVTQVSFYDNSTLLGVDTQAPFSITLSNAQPHYYSIIAVATDDSHLTTPSNPVYFSVNSSPPQPVSRPPNDDFTNRTILTGSFVIVTGSLANATMAVGEQGQCIWWSWTAPETALFTITLQSEPGYYPALSLYTGTDLLDLVLVTNSAFFGLDYSYSTRFIISASAGATYQIAASSLSK
jgi:hypothetical protein